MTKKLSLEIIGYIIIAAMGAIFSYIFIHTAVLTIGSKVLTRSEQYNEYIRKGAKELAAILQSTGVEEDSIGSLLVWNIEYPELQVSLYREDKLYYSSPDFQTSDYGIEEIYVFKVNTPYGVDRIQIYPCYTKQFMIQVSVMSMIASGILFVFFVLFMCHYKFKYLLKISEVLEYMESGDLKKRIPLEGEDELTQVASHINALVCRIEQEIEEEKRLRAHNMQMVSSLSHDIRTPLTAVISYLDFLKEGVYTSSQQREEYIHIASQKALQIKGVTDTLFSYAGMPKGQMNKKDQLYEVHTLADQILLEIDDWLDGCGFTVICEKDISKGHEISIDVVLLRRVLDNLCSNIEKYADKMQPVKVCIKEENQRLIIKLTNGISHKRADVESYGIGLKNCKEIVESYKGKWSVLQDKMQFQVVIELPLQNSLELSTKKLQN
ncbi:MAG: HAMP domain-containing histidine kinase [Candidatus Niameybacter stercoravium]|nr:HAMP domain-containing histidine kinase [Candidatus Niameybacter stercoravium]